MTGRHNRRGIQNGAAKDVPNGDSQISKLQNLNQLLLKEIKNLRADKNSLSEKLMEIQRELTNAEEEKKRFELELGNLRSEFVVAGPEKDNLGAHKVEAGKSTQDEIARKEGEWQQSDMERDDTLLHVEDERQTVKAELTTAEKELEALTKEMAQTKEQIFSLQHQIVEGVKQQSYLNECHKVVEISLREENEMLKNKVCDTADLLELQNGRVDVLTEQINELNQELRSCEEKHVRLMEEKEEQKREFESLSADCSRKLTQLEKKQLILLEEKDEQGKEIESLQVESRRNLQLLEKQSKLLDEKEEEGKEVESRYAELRTIYELSEGKHGELLKVIEEQREEIESLHAESRQQLRALEVKYVKLLEEEDAQRKKIVSQLNADKASLEEEKQLLLKSLGKASKQLDKFSETFIQDKKRMLELENQFSELQAELDVSKAAYNEASLQLTETKENMHQVSNDLYEIRGEREALDKKLTLQFSRNKLLENDLFSARCCLEKMEEDVCKDKQQMANLQAQLSSMAEENAGQILYFQNQLSSIREYKMDLIADLQRHLSTNTADQSCQISDLQSQLSILGEQKKALEEANDCLKMSLQRLSSSSEVKEAQLRERIRELEGANKDLEYKQQLLAERHEKPKQRSFAWPTALASTTSTVAAAALVAYFKYM